MYWQKIACSKFFIMMSVESLSCQLDLSIELQKDYRNGFDNGFDYRKTEVSKFSRIAFLDFELPGLQMTSKILTSQRWCSLLKIADSEMISLSWLWRRKKWRSASWAHKLAHRFYLSMMKPGLWLWAALALLLLKKLARGLVCRRVGFLLWCWFAAKK